MNDTIIFLSSAETRTLWNNVYSTKKKENDMIFQEYSEQYRIFEEEYTSKDKSPSYVHRTFIRQKEIFVERTCNALSFHRCSHPTMTCYYQIQFSTPEEMMEFKLSWL